MVVLAYNPAFAPVGISTQSLLRINVIPDT
jgi:hypothetical protein